jgi:hypothetical protein
MTLPKFTVEAVVPRTMNLSIVMVIPHPIEPPPREADRDHSPEVPTDRSRNHDSLEQRVLTGTACR